MHHEPAQGRGFCLFAAIYLRTLRIDSGEYTMSPSTATYDYLTESFIIKRSKNKVACSKCNRPHQRSYDSYCYTCRQQYWHQWKYNLSPEQFEKLLISQRRSCAICEAPFATTPRVDHDHVTGEVRGLLCNNCNTGLGKLGDTIVNVLKAVQYLAQSPIRPIMAAI